MRENKIEYMKYSFFVTKESKIVFKEWKNDGKLLKLSYKFNDELNSSVYKVFCDWL